MPAEIPITFKGAIFKRDKDGFYVLTDDDDVFYIPDIPGNIINKDEIDLSDSDSVQKFYVKLLIDERGPHGGRTAVAREAMTREKTNRVASERRNKIETNKKFDEAYECAYDEYVDQIKKLKKGGIPCGHKGTPTYPISLNTKYGKNLRDWTRSRNAKRTAKEEGSPKATIINTKPKSFALRFTDDPEKKTECSTPKRNATHEFFTCLDQQGIDVPGPQYPFIDETRRIDANIEPSESMIRDIKRMVLEECRIDIDDRQAKIVAEEILRNAKERDDLYRVPTDKLCKIANRVKRRSKVASTTRPFSERN